MTGSHMRMRPGQRGYNQWRKKNSPPAEKPWVWLTREMMESPAWAALPAPSKRVIERVMIEHMSHGGTMNGELIVTYDDFENYGISRKAIRAAIKHAVGLGFIAITYRGVRSHGPARRPSQYALSWLPMNDGRDATNRWKAIKSAEQAKQIVDAERQRRCCRANGSTGKVGEFKRTPSQDI